MSKQSEAKQRQMYVPKVTPMVCSNCKHFESVVTQDRSYWRGTWTKETGMRCTLGGFKVMKMGICIEHTYCAKPASELPE